MWYQCSVVKERKEICSLMGLDGSSKRREAEKGYCEIDTWDDKNDAVLIWQNHMSDCERASYSQRRRKRSSPLISIMYMSNGTWCAEKNTATSARCWVCCSSCCLPRPWVNGREILFSQCDDVGEYAFYRKRKWKRFACCSLLSSQITEI